MTKLLAASISGIALLGLAACSDVDETTTQTIPAEQTDTMAPAPAPEAAPADDLQNDTMGSDSLESTPDSAPVTPVD
jgi:hypothetical protein